MGFDVVGFAGSLRNASLNRALLRTVAELADPDIQVTTYDLDPIPMYNADLESAGQPPAPVAALRDAVRRCDGILIATPEYNYGVPGVLKNTIDWLSRPARASCMEGKAAAICGATTGMWGTARGQAQLRQVLTSTNTYVLIRPEILVAKAGEKFREGQLVDEHTRELLKTFLAAFADLMRILR